MSRTERICCDPRTKKWFRERWYVETTLAKCDDCGLYYKPSLGHKCKKKDGCGMSYDISFKVKVEGLEKYVDVGDCTANTTWNVREMIRLSTGLPWKNCENNGLCKDVIPHIAKGWANC